VAPELCNCTGTGYSDYSCSTRVYINKLVVFIEFTICMTAIQDCTCTMGNICCGLDCKPIQANNSKMCRVAAGICDKSEYCDGISGLCPPGILLHPSPLFILFYLR
jgi:hypothetical protein